MSFPAYPSYSDLDVDWLRRVPAHWRSKPFWSLFRRVKRTGFPDADLLSVYRDYGIIKKADRDDNFNKPSDDLGTYQLVEPGDLAMNKMKAWQGSLGISPHRGIVSPAYFVFESLNDEVPQYLHYLLRSDEFACGFMTISKGIRVNQWDIDPDWLSQLSIPLPTRAEQLGIVTFLDRETAKIDSLVEEQRRLIELLKEKRQAVISHAVTKGLDPTAPMKDSGVDWLGEVPAHWTVKRLKHLSPSITVGIVVNPSSYVSEEGLPFIYGGDIREGSIDSDGARRIQPADSARQPKTVLREGDLLTVRVGAPGVTAVVPAECDGGNCASVMLIRKGVYPSSWLCHAMNSRYVRYQVEVVQYGAAQEQFNIGHAVNFIMIAPPVSEMVEIAAFIDREAARIDALAREAETAINLLQERRAALISAAVTGKIDVCGLVAGGAEAA